MMLGGAIGTVIAYVGQKTIVRQPPQPDHGIHPAQEQHGPAEAILGGVVIAVAARQAFRYMRSL
jgi:hypothetical protein